MTAPEHKSSVASAAFRALTAWLAIYVVVSQILVIVRWKSSPEGVSHQEAVVAAVNDSPAETTAANLEHQQEAIKQIQQVIDNVKSVNARQAETVASLHEKLDLLRNQVMQPLLRGEPPSQSTTSPELSSFRELLEHATLSEVSEETLLALLDGIQNEVDVIAANNATVDWNQVMQVVTARYRRDDEPVRVCPSGSMDPAIARVSHYTEKWQQLETLLKERGQKVPPLLYNDVQDFLQQQASNPPPPPESDPNRECVSAIELLDMIDEGLDALHRKRDLRGRLENHLLMNFDSIKRRDLILDAVLDPPAPPETKRETINLRQILDTPLLKRVGKGIDGMVDAMGGYNDVLDGYVDKLAAQDSSIGQSITAKMLALAGKVKIPNFWSKVPSKAGMLKQG